MARIYRSPVLLSDEPITPGRPSLGGNLQSTHELKDELSSSFVYGDEHYEEEYVVPDVVEEIAASETTSEEPAE